MSRLAPFTDLAAFDALDPAQRLALADPLAESLGKEFHALPALVGSKGMVAVEHVPSGVQLVAIPGGSFEMGLTADDEDARAVVSRYGTTLLGKPALRASLTKLARRSKRSRAGRAVHEGEPARPADAQVLSSTTP